MRILHISTHDDDERGRGKKKKKKKKGSVNLPFPLSRPLWAQPPVAESGTGRLSYRSGLLGLSTPIPNHASTRAAPSTSGLRMLLLQSAAEDAEANCGQGQARMDSLWEKILVPAHPLLVAKADTPPPSSHSSQPVRTAFAFFPLLPSPLSSSSLLQAARSPPFATASARGALDTTVCAH